MATRLFPAEFHPAEEGGFTVTFPDLPGCVTEGDTFEEAYANAKDVLQGFLDVMQDAGDKIPEPTPLTPEVLADRRKRGVVTVQAVEGQVEGGKAIKLSITMDEDLVKMIDARAGARGRSAFLTQGARVLLARGSNGERGGLAMKVPATAENVTVKGRRLAPTEGFLVKGNAMVNPGTTVVETRIRSHNVGGTRYGEKHTTKRTKNG